MLGSGLIVAKTKLRRFPRPDAAFGCAGCRYMKRLPRKRSLHKERTKSCGRQHGKPITLDRTSGSASDTGRKLGRFMSLSDCLPRLLVRRRIERVYIFIRTPWRRWRKSFRRGPSRSRQASSRSPGAKLRNSRHCHRRDTDSSCANSPRW